MIRDDRDHIAPSSPPRLSRDDRGRSRQRPKELLPADPRHDVGLRRRAGHLRRRGAKRSGGGLERSSRSRRSCRRNARWRSSSREPGKPRRAREAAAPAPRARHRRRLLRPVEKSGQEADPARSRRDYRCRPAFPRPLAVGALRRRRRCSNSIRRAATLARGVDLRFRPLVGEGGRQRQGEGLPPRLPTNPTARRSTSSRLGVTRHTYEHHGTPGAHVLTLTESGGLRRPAEATCPDHSLPAALLLAPRFSPPARAASERRPTARRKGVSCRRAEWEAKIRPPVGRCGSIPAKFKHRTLAPHARRS
jgi:hypothetical protein